MDDAGAPVIHARVGGRRARGAGDVCRRRARGNDFAGTDGAHAVVLARARGIVYGAERVRVNGAVAHLAHGVRARGAGGSYPLPHLAGRVGVAAVKAIGRREGVALDVEVGGGGRRRKEEEGKRR